jgi:GNAT superfamily N-acetyltransferase
MAHSLIHMSDSIEYQVEPGLSVDDFISVLKSSTLAERRPMDDRDRLTRMLAGASVIITARSGGRIVGVSRALTDGAYSTYLADLAVDATWQGRGIGRELIRRTHEAAGVNTMLILLAAPKARSYYPHIGMQPHDSCWISLPKAE